MFMESKYLFQKQTKQKYVFFSKERIRQFSNSQKTILLCFIQRVFYQLSLMLIFALVLSPSSLFNWHSVKKTGEKRRREWKKQSHSCSSCLIWNVMWQLTFVYYFSLFFLLLLLLLFQFRWPKKKEEHIAVQWCKQYERISVSVERHHTHWTESNGKISFWIVKRFDALPKKNMWN